MNKKRMNEKKINEKRIKNKGINEKGMTSSKDIGLTMTLTLEIKLYPAKSLSMGSGARF